MSAPKNSDGLPLWDALREYSDPDTWARFEAGGADSYKALRSLWAAFSAKLKSGELRATGCPRGSIERVEIPSEAFGSLWPFAIDARRDEGRSALAGPGPDDGTELYAVGVRVFGRSTSEAVRAEQSTIRAERLCEKWIRAEAAAGRRPANREAGYEEAKALFRDLTERGYLRARERGAPEWRYWWTAP